MLALVLCVAAAATVNCVNIPLGARCYTCNGQVNAICTGVDGSGTCSGDGKCVVNCKNTDLGAACSECNNRGNMACEGADGSGTCSSDGKCLGRYYDSVKGICILQNGESAPRESHTNIASSQSCQLLCDEKHGCHGYSFTTKAHACTLYITDSVLQGDKWSPCTDCRCIVKKRLYEDYGVGKCILPNGQVAPSQQKRDVTSSESCQKLCDEERGCQGYNYQLATPACTLYITANGLRVDYRHPWSGFNRYHCMVRKVDCTDKNLGVTGSTKCTSCPEHTACEAYNGFGLCNGRNTCNVGGLLCLGSWEQPVGISWTPLPEREAASYVECEQLCLYTPECNLATYNTRSQKCHLKAVQASFHLHRSLCNINTDDMTFFRNLPAMGFLCNGYWKKPDEISVTPLLHMNVTDEAECTALCWDDPRCNLVIYDTRKLCYRREVEVSYQLSLGACDDNTSGNTYFRRIPVNCRNTALGAQCLACNGNADKPCVAVDEVDGACNSDGACSYYSPYGDSDSKETYPEIDDFDAQYMPPAQDSRNAAYYGYTVFNEEGPLNLTGDDVTFVPLDRL
eukprot:GEMP01028227.1.p1 GENE.GEMP01028227.1~~GEMP01028227.1.p1  ORF type:complete len:584 (+),score=64.79 GEMP01028227.1:50-1753(+)